MRNWTSKFDTVAQWSMTLLISLLPIFFIPIVWITTVQAKVILIALLLLVSAISWISARFVEGNVRVPASLVLAGGLLIPLAYACSVAFSGVAQISLVGSGVEQDTLAFACILYAALALSAFIFSGVQNGGVNVLRGLSIGVLLLLGLEVVHFVVPGLSLGGVIASQTGNAFGNWHEFAIVLGFFVVLGLAIRTTAAAAGLWKYLFYLACLVSLGFLVIANFFDVWAALCAAAVVALAVDLSATRARSGHIAFSWGAHGVWVAVVVLAVFSMIFGGYINNVLPSRIKIAHVEVRPSWQGTMDIGGAALTQPASLFFGAGPNTFAREWGLYKPASVNQTLFWNTDFNVGIGSIPTSFITTGILGILAWIVFVVMLLWTSVRALVRRGQDAPDTHYAAALGLASGYLVTFLILYVPGPALTTLTFLVAGLLVAFSLPARLAQPLYASLRGGSIRSVAQSSALAVFGVAVIIASLGVSRVLSSEILLNRSIVVFNETKDAQAASTLIRQALWVNPSSARAHRLAVQLGLVQLQALAAQADTKDEAARSQLQVTLRETIQHGLDAVAINGNDYQNWLELAGLYQQLAGVKVAGAYENARAAYQRARIESPSSPVPLFQLAQLEVLEGHKDIALQNLAAAVQLKPDFAAAYYAASQVYASNGDFKNALSAAALATQYAPQDPLAWYNAGAIAYANKDYTNAIAALEQALTLQSNYANAEYVLGLAYYDAGRPADSLKVFEALATLEPNQQVVQDAIKNLRAGAAPLSVAPPAPAAPPAPVETPVN
ncbi:tetratricopeptide repeat protein [Candidatus Kaiserbacteria bacterium]|nr:tetratricopeptide repeat protein [Candidatus Kaiserbacteria bacterium]